MDLERIRKAGVSTTATGWLTNPVRSGIWRLIVPFFHGLRHELERGRDLDGRSPGQGGGLDPGLAALVDTLRMDQMALARRLASLEDETAETAELLRTVVPGSGASVSVREGADGDPGRSGAGVTVVTTLDGRRFLLDEGGLAAGVLQAGREWEPEVRRAIEDASRPDGVAIDVGAGAGLHTVTMAGHFRHVHAVEPRPGPYRQLCGSLALNGCANVTVHATAVGDGATGLEALGAEDVAFVRVGSEVDDEAVRRGARETLGRWRPVVVVGPGWDAFLDDLGYDVSPLGPPSSTLGQTFLGRPR